MRKIIATAALAVVALSGCSGAEAAAPSTVTVTPPATTVTATTTVTSTVTASPDPQPTSGVLKLGSTAKLGVVDITVYGSKRVTRQEGIGWAVDVKACSKASASEPIGLTWFPWNLVDTNSGTYDWAHTTYNGDPIPAYPNDQDKSVPAGQCARGWIVFEVNADTKAAEVRYANSAGESVAWKLT
ncbi:hypothetical protein ACSDQ9_05825 [Aestuariimicrobium soli]|uniref:hypothetical protein n=1 Tax=Aestuariimicrobium soli TaxID=2035834 RepID=UPI003EBE54E7